MNGHDAFDPRSLKRPDRALLTYYVIISAFTLVAFPFVFLPHLFKYETLRYELDDEGVSMSWGFLFRKEIYLTYRRIQDIHVTRNLIQRWLGLADVAVQTASGSGDVEMVIEGVLDPDTLRDFLYSKMRGARGVVEESVHGVHGNAPMPAYDADEITDLLRQIRDSLRAVRARPGAIGERP